MIIVDVETSGINPAKNSILSIGAIEFERPSNQFYGECRAREGAEIEASALAINGFTREEALSDKKKSVEELLLGFRVWLQTTGDRTIAGHNVSFDVSFLEFSSKLYRINLGLGHRNVDTHALTYASYMKRGMKPPAKSSKSDINSDAVLAYCGLPAEPKPHNGLVGAKMEAEALSRLILGKRLFQEYSGFGVPEYLLF